MFWNFLFSSTCWKFCAPYWQHWWIKKIMKSQWFYQMNCEHFWSFASKNKTFELFCENFDKHFFFNEIKTPLTRFQNKKKYDHFFLIKQNKLLMQIKNGIFYEKNLYCFYVKNRRVFLNNIVTLQLYYKHMKQ